MYTVAEGGTVPVMLNCSLPASEDYTLTVSQSGGGEGHVCTLDMLQMCLLILASCWWLFYCGS